jgi:hypothetical protein
MKTSALLLCSLLAVVPAWGRPAAPAGQLVVPAAHPFVLIAVNGEQLRLKVDLGASSGVILNPEAATRARLAEEGSTVMRIGPVKLRGSWASPGLELGGARWKTRLRWFDRSFVGDADGVVGPHDLPFADVVFEGPGKSAREPFALRTRYTEDRGIFVPVKVAGKKVAVRFSLLREQSFATGAAGALLARQNGGALEGSAIQQHIGWDVSRPTRRLMLARPWTVGGFHFRSVLVRLRDYRGKSVLPTADAEAGPTDILVTGRVGARQGAEHFMTVGLDQLQTCETVAYSRVTDQLSFRC